VTLFVTVKAFRDAYETVTKSVTLFDGTLLYVTFRDAFEKIRDAIQHGLITPCWMVAGNCLCWQEETS